MNDNEVTITKAEYKRLLECENERIVSEPSGGVCELQDKLNRIVDLCGFRSIQLREKIIGDPYIFIDSILSRIVEIADEKTSVIANRPMRTACGMKMLNDAMKPTIEQIKEIIRLAKTRGYISGDEKLTLPEIVKLAEKVLNREEKTND